MNLRNIVEPREVERDPESFAEGAFKLIELALDSVQDLGSMEQLILDHISHENQGIVFHQKYEKEIYHPNVVISAEVRVRAYELMLERLKSL